MLDLRVFLDAVLEPSRHNGADPLASEDSDTAKPNCYEDKPGP